MIAKCWVEETDYLEVCWAVPFTVSPYRPATYLDPPEGGPEIDGEPYVCAVILHGLEINNIQEGSILDILTRNRYSLSEERQWEAVAEAGGNSDD